MSDSAVSLTLTAALAAIEAQRKALLEDDLQGLQQAGEVLSQALATLRGQKSELNRDDLARLRHAAQGVGLNADMLSRLSSANQRALNVLFEPSVTYGSPGSVGLAKSSRVLNSA